MVNNFYKFVNFVFGCYAILDKIEREDEIKSVNFCKTPTQHQSVSKFGRSKIKDLVKTIIPSGAMHRPNQKINLQNVLIVRYKLRIIN